MKGFIYPGILAFGLTAGTAMAAPLSVEQAPAKVTQCLDFSEKAWAFTSNTKAKAWPKVNKGTLTLLPDNLYSASAAAILRSNLQPPFEVTFEYRTYDDDGGSHLIWNSADGISFFFYKDGASYGTPPTGGFLGFSRSGGGYAVQLPTYGQRQARFRAASGSTFQATPFRQAYTHGQWVPLRVLVQANRVQTWSGNRKLLDVALNFDTQFTSLGFSAATGAADSEHQVRAFCVTPIRQKATESKPEQEAKPEPKPAPQPEPPVAPAVAPEVKPEELKLPEPSVEQQPITPDVVEQVETQEPVSTPETSVTTEESEQPASIEPSTLDDEETGEPEDSPVPEDDEGDIEVDDLSNDEPLNS
ncbi:lectin-like domain-containing protein [Parendozoicomonas haliclonae]|nr:hypothetical protein [Parendozoicomonas haliclonae]